MRYAGTAPGETLRRLWLNRLHAPGLGGLRPQLRRQRLGDRECRYRAALLAVGRTEDAFDGLEQRYLTGASLPDVCDPVFARWHAAGGLTPELVWQRVGLALARAIRASPASSAAICPPGISAGWTSSSRCTATPRVCATRSCRMTRTADRGPGRGHRAAREPGPEPRRRRLVRPARPRAGAAERQGSRQHRDRRRLAAEGDRRALVYLLRLRPLPENLELQRTRLRAALRLAGLAGAGGVDRALPPEERERGEWQYWLARALGKAGDLVGAAHALDIASHERDLWGFRAAELLGRPPALRERADAGGPGRRSNGCSPPTPPAASGSSRPSGAAPTCAASGAS
jgi:soluble lytic murein transglycosylase